MEALGFIPTRMRALTLWMLKAVGFGQLLGRQRCSEIRASEKTNRLALQQASGKRGTTLEQQAAVLQYANITCLSPDSAYTFLLGFSGDGAHASFPSEDRLQEWY